MDKLFISIAETVKGDVVMTTRAPMYRSAAALPSYQTADPLCSLHHEYQHDAKSNLFHFPVLQIIPAIIILNNIIILLSNIISGNIIRLVVVGLIIGIMIRIINL